MRIVSASSFLLASLALSGSSCAAPADATSSGSGSPLLGQVISGTKKPRSYVNPARSHDEFDNNPLAIDNILKPLELIPCGLGISTPHHIPPGHKVDCPELNSRILGGEITGYKADQAQPTRTHSMASPRAFATSTTMPHPSDTADFVDPSSYPPTEPSSFYEVDPTLRPDILNPPQMPVMSVIKPTVPGGPAITTIVGHLSIVPDVPPTSSPSTTTLLPSPTSAGDQEN